MCSPEISHKPTVEEQMEQNKKISIDKAYHSSGLSNSNKLSELEERFFCPKYIMKLLGKGSDVCSNVGLYYNDERLLGDIMNYSSSHDVIV